MIDPAYTAARNVLVDALTLLYRTYARDAIADASLRHLVHELAADWPG